MSIVQLGNKADLAAIGKAKMSEGGQVTKEERFVKNDKACPTHNTRTEIAKAAGVSTGQVAQAEIVKRKAPAQGYEMDSPPGRDSKELHPVIGPRSFWATQWDTFVIVGTFGGTFQP